MDFISHAETVEEQFIGEENEWAPSDWRKDDYRKALFFDMSYLWESL